MWSSYSTTIGKFFRVREALPLPPQLASILETMNQLLVAKVLGGHDRDTVLAAYHRNNEKVRDTIPADRLLVFSPADGWAPLCRFLEVPVPAGPSRAPTPGTSSGPISEVNRQWPEPTLRGAERLGCLGGYSALLALPPCARVSRERGRLAMAAR